MSETPIIFANELMRFYPEHRLLVCDTYHLTVPERQFQVLEPLARNLGEVVMTEELVDLTKPGLIIPADRYRQLLRVQATIKNLRQNFNRIIDGLGDPDTGVIQNEFGTGYYLSPHWDPYSYLEC